jgi:hypothetical protein
MRNPVIYTVHIDPKLPNAYEHPVFVKEGFNGWGFFFPLLACLYHRLWLPALLLLGLDLLCWHYAGNALDLAPYLALLRLFISLFTGFHLNDWRRAKLKRLGWVTADIVVAESLQRVEMRFFDRYFSQHPTGA